MWRSTGKQIASTTPQMWLVAGSHLGFAEKSFHSIASDKNRGQVPSRVTSRGKTNCHGERLLASWPSVNNLLSLTQCGDLLAMRLPRRVFYTSRNDKVLRQEPRASSIASDKNRVQVPSQ